MTVNAAPSEQRQPLQPEVLVRRILLVAEILARAPQTAMENECENRSALELRYPELEAFESES